MSVDSARDFLGKVTLKQALRRTPHFRFRQKRKRRIRNNIITREEGVALIKKYDGEFPKKYFNEILEYLDMKEDEFYEIIDSFRPDHIWKKENNINGTGRTLEFLVNTNNDNKEFILSTSDKFFLNNKINHGYSIIYKENDYTKSQSYKLNTLTLDTNFNYVLSENTYHTLGFGYSLKDYNVTNTSTATTNIKNL